MNPGYQNVNHLKIIFYWDNLKKIIKDAIQFEWSKMWILYKNNIGYYFSACIYLSLSCFEELFDIQGGSLVFSYQSNY